MQRMIKIFSVVLSIGLLSNACSDDDDKTGPDTGAGEAESAWMYMFYLETPEGRIHYMDAVEALPSEANVESAVELGINARTYAAGEHVYSISTTSATLTKWKVDRTTLGFSPSNILSYASTGVGNGWVDRAVFFSETQAYISNFDEGLLLEFDPSEMTITKVHDIPALPEATVDEIRINQSEGDIIGDKVVWTLDISQRTCCEYIVPTGAVSAVWDPASASFQYNRDQRSLAADRQIVFDENGGAYVQPSRNNGFSLQYMEEVPENPGYTLLKLDENGNFDPNFSFDFAEAVPVQWYGRATTIYGGKIIFTYAEFEWPEAWEDRWSFYGDANNFKTVSVDLVTKEVAPFTAFDGYGETSYQNTIDGINYYTGFGDESADLLRQDGLDFTTVLSTKTEGGILMVAKLW